MEKDTNKLSPDMQPLTDDDIDIAYALTTMYFHAAERMSRIIESAYEQRYRETKDYKQRCKLYGKARTDTEAKRAIKDMVRGDERNKIGRLLKIADNLHVVMEGLNRFARKTRTEDVSEWRVFDIIINDTNFMCYTYALMANCLKEEDSLKIVSTLKLLAKGDVVSDRLLTRLEPKDRKL